MTEQFKLLFTEFEGDLYRRSDQKIIRKRYSYHFNRPESAAQVAACLRAGPCAWPGGYPLFFITSDGAALCFKCTRKEFRNVAQAYLPGWSRTGWHVSGCEVNWEDSSLICDNCNLPIESAYGEDPARVEQSQ